MNMLKKLIIAIVSLFICASAITTIANAREITPVPHWQKKEISVYIPDTKDKKTVSALKSAFSQWQSASVGHINFKYVKQGPADIDVIFSDKASGTASPYTNTSVKSDSNSISKSEIHIANENNEFKTLSNKYLSNIMLNEVGKALGVPNNTTKPSSIMHDPVSEKQKFMKVDAVKLFSISEWSYSKRNINKKENLKDNTENNK